METINASEEDWDLLLTFFPTDWKNLAHTSGALKGLRQDKSEENCLRVLLMHLGCGLSMRETVVRARQAKLADISDVALLKRLRKSKEWLYLRIPMKSDTCSNPNRTLFRDIRTVVGA